MAPDAFIPTEEQIQRVLQQTDSDPRKLAIAYLRAQNRARENGLGFGIMGDLNEALVGAAVGREDVVAKAKKKMETRVKSFKETRE